MPYYENKRFFSLKKKNKWTSDPVGLVSKYAITTSFAMIFRILPIANKNACQ